MMTSTSRLPWIGLLATLIVGCGDDDDTPPGTLTTSTGSESGNEESTGTPGESGSSTGDGEGSSTSGGSDESTGGEALSIRVATFNASLNRSNAGDLITNLTDGDAQAEQIAEVIQRVAPDLILINEFDYDVNDEALTLFREQYLNAADAASPIDYTFFFSAPSNTGVPSGFDLDNADSGAAGDAFGFGFFEGQFAFAVLSRYPIQTDSIRCFQNFLWRDMPNALLPDDPETDDPNDWYTSEELEVVRLSSKNHCDVPVDVEGHIIHLLVSHPTPPTFDGLEDRNGTRNHDEIRFWADYIQPESSAYITDDNDVSGGLAEGASFVILGDLNADPLDGDSVDGAANQLLNSSRVNATLTPVSAGAIEDGPADDQAAGVTTNADHIGPAEHDTADFGEPEPGNLRVDYVLPSTGLNVTNAGVFWPATTEPGAELADASDHHLVWIDILLD